MSNVFSCTGAVGRDAEVRHTASGLAILNVTIANNIGFGDKQKTLWLKVTVFGKRAEGCLADYLKKGQIVFVSGELTQNEYKAQDGSLRTSLELNATIVDLIGKRDAQQGGGAPHQAGQTQQSSPYHAQPSPSAAMPPGYEDFDDDIPF